MKSPCHSRRTPQENWDVRPKSPAAVEMLYEKNDSRNKRLNSIKPLPLTDTTSSKWFIRKKMRYDIILYEYAIACYFRRDTEAL